MPEITTNGDHEKINGEHQEQEEEIDPHFEPIISLPLIDVSSNEEDEVEMLKLRAKLYRYDSSNDPPEWKERGTGDVKLLRHKTKHTVRVVMRRDKTLKICANHFITPWMELKPNCGSDRAWVWSVLADYADELLKPELLAIRFANAENASLWKETFEKAKKIVGTECEIYAGKNNPDAEVDSDSDSSYNETDESDAEDKAPENPEKESNEKEATNTNKTDSSTDQVTEQLTNLDVKDTKEE
ncbi:GSCOCG00002185001-RA-CDS [Cotesia congregata]|uniref:Similar to RANBP1: Ran-specific GTPase-activating protein (Homo sapiens) n=1 Tax=Cotesia congregata TaxID=51543 RepID=A0A8J2HR94_COTCN|nr:GSCOCG00002185001-RA-CDS [Cotesia congregata]CAG5103991.1 Similar to RANBP1: Ran-specific GTPase-activating protein (Homo sapiens) [Cotesia congregata]